MSEHAETTSTKAVIAGAEPQLFVADIKSSCDFFTGKLGFAIAFTYGEPPFYAQVRRDAALINLRCVRSGRGPSRPPQPSHAFTVMRSPLTTVAIILPATALKSAGFK
jgi:catechol 2,3-dioxygenase-like lactoylglutathione lyase family enzyme